MSDDSSQNITVPDQKACPFCGEGILAVAQKCKHCGEFLSKVETVVAKHQIAIAAKTDGHLTFVCAYEQAFTLLERAMLDCEVRTREVSRDRGVIEGNVKYGINAFGMAVTAILYSEGPLLSAQVVATFTDSIDITGVGKKKVAQIIDKVVFLSQAGSDSAQSVSGPLPARSGAGQAMPPSYSARSGASFKGKATTGFVMSLFGLAFFPVGIGAIIFGTLALRGMSNSLNKAGKGLAIASTIIGGVDVVLGLVYLAVK